MDSTSTGGVTIDYQVCVPFLSFFVALKVKFKYLFSDVMLCGQTSLQIALCTNFRYACKWKLFQPGRGYQQRFSNEVRVRDVECRSTTCLASICRTDVAQLIEFKKLIMRAWSEVWKATSLVLIAWWALKKPDASTSIENEHMVKRKTVFAPIVKRSRRTHRL